MLLDDLPEELVREIFGYFTDADVYFKLRYICRKIHDYAESYVELGKSNVFVINKALNRNYVIYFVKEVSKLYLYFHYRNKNMGYRKFLPNQLEEIEIHSRSRT